MLRKDEGSSFLALCTWFQEDSGGLRDYMDRGIVYG